MTSTLGNGFAGTSVRFVAVSGACSSIHACLSRISFRAGLRLTQGLPESG